jgi:tetratricopeptide (TPR) repeat protein
MINVSLGHAFYLAGEYDQAIEAWRKTLELDPNSFYAHSYLGMAYEAQGMYEQAIAEHQKAVASSGGVILTRAWLGHAYALSGKRAEAQKILDELHKLSKQRYVSPFQTAIIYTGLGKKDQAFAWLEKAYEERDSALNHVKVEPRFDGLRSDPRFTALLKKMGLER